MNPFRVFAAILLITGAATARSLIKDSQIREETYSKPLKEMSKNTEELFSAMLDAYQLENATASPEELRNFCLEIWRILSEGAVEQRNHEMKKTRKLISPIAKFLSWFMKNEGLTYKQIEAKYKEKFTGAEVELHKQIIKSASTANRDVFNKLVLVFLTKIGLLRVQPQLMMKAKL